MKYVIIGGSFIVTAVLVLAVVLGLSGVSRANRDAAQIATLSRELATDQKASLDVSATQGHLGLCVNIAVQTGVLYLPVGTANPVASPVLTDGVPSCPAGQFISVVPQR